MELMGSFEGIVDWLEDNLEGVQGLFGDRKKH
jgi:hypothetical protein